VIEHLVASGVPVMGHLGLTPQHIHQLGGFHVQGKGEQQADTLLKHAEALASLGCFAVVLECVPAELAQRISQSLSIFTIGIGAGVGTDGQVLVLHDLLGIGGFSAKFLKKYLAGDALVAEAVTAYCNEVAACAYPAKEHSYHD
jgi:3-methyl-2-oxobutanoate hydroxymethyltransferase